MRDIPAVVIKSKFVLPQSKTFKQYIEYVDRDEAKKKINEPDVTFGDYQDYMNDQGKTTALFDNISDRLNKGEKNNLKKKFEVAQKNKSIMWQDVISFDNDWLKEHGILDENNGYLNEVKMKNATRLAVNEMLKKEGLNKTATWSAAIHYNTDNIHIHVATVEISPTRDRGKRRQQSIESMKSKVINNLMDRAKEHQKINDLIRKNIVGSKKDDMTLSFKNRSLKKDFIDIYKKLPVDRRHWSYGYKTISHVKPQIDELTKRYIDKHHKKDFNELIKQLDKEVQVLKKSYGDTKKNDHEDYKKNKIDDLYKRMGNAFLKEMRGYDKSINGNKKLTHHEKNEKESMNVSPRSRFKRNAAMNQMKYGMDRIMKNEYKNWRNQMIYERLSQQTDVDYER